MPRPSLNACPVTDKHITDAVRQAARGQWPKFISGADVYRIIVFIEAAAMFGTDEALRCFDVFYEEGLEDETWTQYLEGHVATLQTLEVANCPKDEHGCADREVAAHYATLTTKAPPLYIDKDIIMDGKHRMEAALKRGDVYIDAYMVSR